MKHKHKTYYFYRSKVNVEETTIPDDISIVKTMPHPHIAGMQHMQIGWLRWLYYNVYTIVFRGYCRVFKEYDIIKRGKIVSKAVLISKVPNYKFLPNKGVHICYCETLESERGQGYYPLLLKYIQNAEPSLDLHMMVLEDNVASIKGIEKAGFIRYAEGIKKENGHFLITKSL